MSVCTEAAMEATADDEHPSGSKSAERAADANNFAATSLDAAELFREAKKTDAFESSSSSDMFFEILPSFSIPRTPS